MPTITTNNTIVGTSGDDNLRGRNLNDLIIGSDGDDLIFGGGGTDVLLGNSGQDALYGGNANDELYGGTGNDLLLGGSGSDFLSGDRGSDTLEGGLGNDVFSFNTLHLGDGVDTINDFTVGEDVIAIQNGSTSNLSFVDTGSDVDVYYSGVLIATLLGVPDTTGPFV